MEDSVGPRYEFFFSCLAFFFSFFVLVGFFLTSFFVSLDFAITSLLKETYWHHSIAARSSSSGTAAKLVA